MEFYPEGHRIETTQNRLRTASLFALAEAAKSQDILEGKAVVCDAAHNLIVELGEGLRGIIPREEGALGIREGTTRDIAIISRVNKPVCFVVTGFETRDGAVMPVLSRRAAQQRCSDEWLCRLVPGDVIDARITHLEPFGAFADIGCGIASLLPIDAISILTSPRPFFCRAEDSRGGAGAGPRGKNRALSQGASRNLAGERGRFFPRRDGRRHYPLGRTLRNFYRAGPESRRTCRTEGDGPMRAGGECLHQKPDPFAYEGETDSDRGIFRPCLPHAILLFRSGRSYRSLALFSTRLRESD